MSKEPPWSVLLPAMALTVGCMLAPVWGAGLWMAFLPGIILPLVGASALGRLMFFARASQSWPSTSGEVTSSSLRKRIKFRSTPDASATYFENAIRYQYEMDGRAFLSDRVAFGSVPNTLEQNRYRQGSSVPVFYNPNNPSMSVLQPGGSARLLLGLMVLLALASGFTITVALLYRLKT